MTETVGVVPALDMERRWIGDPAPLVEVSGIGARRARDASRLLVDRGASALVSWGVAGGLDPELSAGTVVLPDAVIRGDGQRVEVDLEWRDRLVDRILGQINLSTAPVLTVDRPLASPGEKSEAHQRTGAGAVDMESAAVASVAAGAGVPFITVRVVVDTADMGLPASATSLCDESGWLNLGSALRLVFRPGDWAGLAALARANAAAGRAMRTVWAMARPDLALSEDIQ